MSMNPFDLLKQFQDMQGKMGEIQEKMKTITVEGTSGGDMVKMKINGQMEVLSVQISKEAVDPDDIRMLEDLVLAAFTDAMYKIKEKLREEMSSLTGGIDLPPGLLGM